MFTFFLPSNPPRAAQSDRLLAKAFNNPGNRGDQVARCEKRDNATDGHNHNPNHGVGWVFFSDGDAQKGQDRHGRDDCLDPGQALGTFRADAEPTKRIFHGPL